MSSALFSSYRLRGVTLPNRTVVSPMCEYSAVDGNAQDWHLMHLGQFATSGIGLVITEAAAVEPRWSSGDELVDGVFLRHIEAWLGSRDGRFRQSARVDYDGEGLQPAIADLTEDGHPDLLLGDMSLASFSIWRGDGQGGFERHATFPAGIKAREPHLGDLDGDGDLDLVLPRHRVVEIHGNRGQGQFSKLTTLEVAAGKGMATPENLSLGDVDNDGDLDLVIPLSDDQALEIWLNRGSGRFDRHVRHERPMLSPSHSALGDFDGDGNLDLVLGGAEARLLIARGDGHGDFDLQRAQRLAIDGDPTEVVVVQFDGDPTPELIVAGGLMGIFSGDRIRHSPMGFLTVYGRGAQELERRDGAKIDLHVTRGIAVEELDGNDYPELIYAASGSKPGSHLAVLMGKPCD